MTWSRPRRPTWWDSLEDEDEYFSPCFLLKALLVAALFSISRLAVRDNTTFKLGLSFHLDHVGKLGYKKAGHSGNSGSKPKCSDPERRVMEKRWGWR